MNLFGMTSDPSVSLHPSRRQGMALHWQVLLLGLWLTTICNVALWQQLWALPEVEGWRGMRFMLGMGGLVLGVLMALMALFA